MQWGAYLHRIGHVVIRRVIDAGEEVLTQLWTEGPGSAPASRMLLPGVPRIQDFYLFTPKTSP